MPIGCTLRSVPKLITDLFPESVGLYRSRPDWIHVGNYGSPSELYLSLRFHHPTASYFATSCYQSLYQGCHISTFTLHCFADGVRSENDTKLVSVLLHPHNGVVEGTITETIFKLGMRRPNKLSGRSSCRERLYQHLSVTHRHSCAVMTNDNVHILNEKVFNISSKNNEYSGLYGRSHFKKQFPKKYYSDFRE